MPSRLDILIYAHDGRGLGHTSRSVAIGMALRRLYPDLKVLFISGCRFTQDLIGSAPLDWLKLPSYETCVVAGKSRGITGKSMFSDVELGVLRGWQLEQTVALYRPRVVLVDHSPQGKHKELVPALTESLGKTSWVLGVRGVLGAVAQAKSALGVQLFNKHYKALLWYGDSIVLGESHLDELRHQYNIDPLECGYVLRLAESAHWSHGCRPGRATLAGTISIPWVGEKTLIFLGVLAEALTRIPAALGDWHLYISQPDDTDGENELAQLFSEISGCYIFPPGRAYVSSLMQSKTALIYGGYNSLMDIVYTELPAIVVMREMQDNEQQIHLSRLQAACPERIHAVSESEVTAAELERLLLRALAAPRGISPAIQINGAESAARFLFQLLR